MNETSEQPKLVYVGGHIPSDLHRRMRIYGAMHGIRLRDILSLAIESFLNASPKTPD
jgi:hypothetical protein